MKEIEASLFIKRLEFKETIQLIKLKFSDAIIPLMEIYRITPDKKYEVYISIAFPLKKATEELYELREELDSK